MRKFSTNKLCLLALCSVINLIGGHIALLFRASGLSGFSWHCIRSSSDGTSFGNDPGDYKQSHWRRDY